MNTPQIVLIALLSAEAAIHLAKDGDRHPDYCGWDGILSGAAFSAILYWGGFFS